MPDSNHTPPALLRNSSPVSSQVKHPFKDRGSSPDLLVSGHKEHGSHVISVPYSYVENLLCPLSVPRPWGSKTQSPWRITANGGRSSLIPHSGTRNHVFRFAGHSTTAQLRGACRIRSLVASAALQAARVSGNRSPSRRGIPSYHSCWKRRSLTGVPGPQSVPGVVLV